MNKYQITHYWSDENTIATTLEQYTLKAKNEDNIIKRIKKIHAKTRQLKKEIYDIGCYPTNIGINLYFNGCGEELTQKEYNQQIGEITEDTPNIFYGWEIIEID